MRIERFDLKRQPVEKFADEYGLVMEIHERSHRPGPTRFYATFQKTDILDGPFLRGEFGDGATEQEAIRNYALAIQGRILVVDAGKSSRRELVVPILISETE
jgi:hypothetical protein